MISSISAQDKLHFRPLETKVNSDVFIEYCQAFLAENPDRPIFPIADGQPSHRSNKTKEWVLPTNGRRQLFYLPGYSPQLNADEWVWKKVRADHI
jgi:transposase